MAVEGKTAQDEPIHVRDESLGNLQAFLKMLRTCRFVPLYHMLLPLD
jgi:hypothetical protein